MMTIDQITARGQEALREALLKELTGSVNEEALLKEHYDSLQDLTNISKKTLKRFFREKVQVGPQTRNLLAAIALGRKDELLTFQDKHNDYYLTFLESLETRPAVQEIPGKASSSAWQLGSKLCQHYRQKLRNGNYVDMHCWRRRIRRGSTLGDRYHEIPLSGQLLFNHQRLLLLGAAGMGKTTFAQHACREWCEADVPDNNLPLYIDLKSDAYDRQENGLLNFLLNTYFGEDLDLMVLDFLETHSQNYYLLLDGFDELTAKEKSLLMTEIAALSAGVRYVILSRPYGFQDFDYPCKTVYELAGFNIKGQEAYIDHLMPGGKMGLKFASLMTFIHGHPILSGLSRSPVALSQIVTLVQTEKSYGLLERVRSGVDLQAAYDNYLKAL